MLPMLAFYCQGFLFFRDQDFPGFVGVGVQPWLGTVHGVARQKKWLLTGERSRQPCCRRFHNPVQTCNRWKPTMREDTCDELESERSDRESGSSVPQCGQRFFWPELFC